jgi:hypothetical protein
MNLFLNVPRMQADAVWQFAISRDLFYVVDNIVEVLCGTHHTVTFAFGLFDDFKLAHDFLRGLS